MIRAVAIRTSGLPGARRTSAGLGSSAQPVRVGGATSLTTVTGNTMAAEPQAVPAPAPPFEQPIGIDAMLARTQRTGTR
ncbi:hypothetical protein [Pandoraea sputorum]|uniref:hypothetical protein n=1 Tax=Pandoraea sputorum TaxID=93222 RepID=UPI0012427F04|nr:hypothetical protein [Pandoraea sputorum]